MPIHLALLSSIWRRLTRKKSPALEASRVRAVVQRHGLCDWYWQTFDERAQRPETWRPCFWIHDHMPPAASVLETGCGIATTTAWLAEHGFQNLAAFDIDEKVVAAARDIIADANASALVWKDDGLGPTYLPFETWDVILAINWLMLVEGFDLQSFVSEYAARLNAGGALFFDVIDASYDEHPLAAYLTSDWQKPIAERRPSEYKHRYSRGDIERAASEAGLSVELLPSTPQLVPRKTYLLRKAARAACPPEARRLQPKSLDPV